MKRTTNIIVSLVLATIVSYLLFKVLLPNTEWNWSRHGFLFVGSTLGISMWGCELIKRIFPKKSMADTIKKIRSESRYYQVLRSYGLFGDFSLKFLSNEPEWDYAKVVLARNPQEAALRAYRRGYGRERGANFNRTTKEWARWAVKPLDKPDNFRYIIYFD